MISRSRAAAFLTILAVPLAGCQTGTATGAAGGVVAGAVVGDPVGAVVGGAAGAAVGGLFHLTSPRECVSMW
jgi:hypothetical protein